MLYAMLYSYSILFLFYTSRCNYLLYYLGIIIWVITLILCACQGSMCVCVGERVCVCVCVRLRAYTVMNGGIFVVYLGVYLWYICGIFGGIFVVCLWYVCGISVVYLWYINLWYINLWYICYILVFNKDALSDELHLFLQ